MIDLKRWYTIDRSIADKHRCFAVYEDKEFVCTGLTQLQAQDFCKGSSLLDMGVIELML